jgi:hypothetical protein
MFPEHGFLGESTSERQALIDLEAKVSRMLMPAIFRSMAQQRNSSEQLLEGWNLGRIMHQTFITPGVLVPIWPLLIRRVQFLKDAAFSFAPNLSQLEFQNFVLVELEKLIDQGRFIGGRTQISQADLTAYAAIYISASVPLTGSPPYLQMLKIKAWTQRLEEKLPASFQTFLFPKAPNRVTDTV